MNVQMPNLIGLWNVDDVSHSYGDHADSRHFIVVRSDRRDFGRVSVIENAFGIFVSVYWADGNGNSKYIGGGTMSSDERIGKKVENVVKKHLKIG